MPKRLTKICMDLIYIGIAKQSQAWQCKVQAKLTVDGGEARSLLSRPSHSFSGAYQLLDDVQHKLLAIHCGLRVKVLIVLIGI